MTRAGAVCLSIDQLRAGVTCSYPIEDGSGILLLGSGTRITDSVIAALRERNLDSIEVHPNDVQRLTNAKPLVFKRSGQDRFTGVWKPGVPLKELLVNRFGELLSEKRSEALTRGLAAAKARFDQLQQLLADGSLYSIASVSTISDAYARSILDDHDQTVGVIGDVERDADLTTRSVRVSVLGMAIAVELGLDGPKTLEVGLSGLLHDIGLLMLDPKLRDSNTSMSAADRWEYEKHPIIANDCLTSVRGLSNSVQLAVQQVHEQYDGTGFPRALRGPRIHLYARILNVIDCYLQLISPASNRCAILPHDAIGLILHHATRGIFDPQVIRAFLRVESMFPLGSLVELSSGRSAKVIRRTEDNFACPVLLCEDGERIETANSNEKILRPLPSPGAAQMRIPVSQMSSIQWNPAENRLLV